MLNRAWQVLADNPGHARALCLQARALDKSGRAAEALDAWRRTAESLDRADPGEPMREEAALRLSLAGARPSP
jgi:cytochrome c-type biogenesis protein CcmH/NrfG